MRVEDQIEIKCSPAQVFEFLSVQENHPKFIKENVSSKQETPLPMQKGSRVVNVARAMGKTMIERFEITEFEPGKVLAKSSLEGSTFSTTDRFELTETPGGTRVKLVVTGAPSGFGQRIMLLFIEPIMRRSMKEMLAKLKEILEAQSKAA